MRRRGFAALATLAVLFLSFCACETGEQSGLSESDSSESALPEVSSVPVESLPSVPAVESSVDVSIDVSSQVSAAVSSEEFSEPADGEFRPWRGDGEPDLKGLRLPAIPEEGFSFLQRSLTLRAGETGKVAYEFQPVGASNRTLTWSSSDETVVTVSDGKLTAGEPGTAIVRAETAAGNSAECRVTVVSPDALSSLTLLALRVTGGELAGRKFSRYDANLDGNAELFVRETGADGVPVVTAYASDGRVLLSTRTGDGEEWAIWRREGGERYLLLSYTRTVNGNQRYALDEVTASGSSAICSPLFARETAPDGSVSYFRASGGGLATCDGNTYDRLRKEYFTKNHQLPETVLQWVSGETERELDEELRALKLPGEL